TFLASDFPSARIISVSYNSAATASDDRATIENLAKGIAQHLVEMAGVGQAARPVVFIGHSLGGIVMEKVFIEVSTLSRTAGEHIDSTLYQNLFNNMRGVVWYGTPHAGAPLAGKAKIFGGMRSTVANLLTPFHDQLADIHGTFSTLLPTSVLRRSFFEQQALRKGPFAELIVPQVSARIGGGADFPLDYDHIDICKPDQKDGDTRYVFLKQFIDRVLAQRRVERQVESTLEEDLR
ncbi:hypothetical protein JKP88DRAFT_317331, partial [Tribonema minus]